MRRFRFGVICKQARPAREFAELARRAEALGFSTLYVPDHFVDHPLAPVPAMATAAAVTDTLRVGSLVLGNDYKHPVVLARELATVDLLSDGRLELGLGAGWMTVDYEKAGISLDPPGVRIERLQESVAIVKGLFADGPFSFEGEHYTVTDLDGHPKPVQLPHPPFVIGGGGRRMLRYAAREADIVGINANLKSGDPNAPDAALSMSGPSTDEKIGWVREAAGARFAELELQVLVGFVHVTDDPGRLVEGIAPAFDVAPEEAQPPVLLIGSHASMVDELRYRRERWWISYHVVPEEFVDDVAPVVAELAGT